MLSAGMLFYVYMIVGDSRHRQSQNGIWEAFRQEKVRVLVALLLLIFAVAHRWFLIIVKLDHEFMRYERLVQRTVTIYSLMSEINIRGEHDKFFEHQQVGTALRVSHSSLLLGEEHQNGNATNVPLKPPFYMI